MKIELEGKVYDLDINQAKKLNLLREEDQRCKSWEEFKNKYQKKQGFFYNEWDERIELTANPISTYAQLTENEAIATKAFSKLLKLRRDWIGDWEPDWCNSMERKYYIEVHRNEFYVHYCSEYPKTFSFPTKEMTEEFWECFKDLFEQCKNLI